MSSSDLFVEGFPHGTPQGYDDGCRGGACPAGTEYGLSCKTAKLKSRSDYQYQQLAKRGATVAEIADALGFIGTETDAAPVVTQAKPKPKATPATAKGARTIADEPKPIAEPVVEEAAPETPEPPRMNGPRASSSTIATGNASGSTTTDEQPAAKPAEIRAWAIAKGYQVSTKGKLPQHIIDHYWEATGRLGADPDEAKLPAAIAEHVEQLEETLTEQLLPIPVTEVRENLMPDGVAAILTDGEQHVAIRTRPEWGQVAESVDVEAARSLAVRLEQELAHAEEQRDAEHDAAEGLADVLIDTHRKLLELQEKLDRVTQQRDRYQVAAEAGEVATRLALRKWAEERANNEASYAVILEQASTINYLSQLDTIQGAELAAQMADARDQPVRRRSLLALLTR